MDNNAIDPITVGAEKALTAQTQNMLQTLGGWANSLLANSEWLMDWRLRNLERTTKLFKDKCDEIGISIEDQEIVAAKFGITWLEGASQEEDSNIQSLWVTCPPKPSPSLKLDFNPKLGGTHAQQIVFPRENHSAAAIH